jgi:DNA-binding protein H-NS
MTPENLEKLADEELHAVIGRAHEVLNARDLKRKDKAREDARAKMEEAHAILIRAGLTPQELGPKRKAAKGRSGKSSPKAPAYRGGHRYQHPSNPALVWNAKGKKPQWLAALEAEGKSPVEVAHA